MTTANFNDFKIFLISINYTMVSEINDYISGKTDDKIYYKCDNNHTRNFSTGGFINQKSRYNTKKIKYFCNDCKNDEYAEEEFKKYKKEIQELNKHEIIKYKNTKDLEYNCGNCGDVSHSSIKNLRKSIGYCQKCEYQTQINSFGDVEKMLEEYGVKLLRYENNKNVYIKCICGTEYKTTLIDIKRGKQCRENCKTRKFIDTCMKKYGVTNVMSVKEIFDKQQKNGYTAKNYIFPSNNTKVVLGYEPRCLDILLGIDRSNIFECYDEKQIFVTADENMIVFDYIYNDKKKMYYPDIMIIENDKNIKFIEVKSERYYFTDYKKNMAKMEYVSKQYNIELWVFNNKKLIQIEYFNKDGSKDKKCFGEFLKKNIELIN